MIITKQEYHEEVKSIARCVKEEAAKYGQDIYDVLHETVDGHEWVIYTYKARALANLVGNPDAWKDFGGEFSDEGRAYAGLMEDIQEELNRA